MRSGYVYPVNKLISNAGEVAYKTSSINSGVHIAIDQESCNGWEYQMSIIVIDLNGDVVWRADNATGVITDDDWWASATSLIT